MEYLLRKYTAAVTALFILVLAVLGYRVATTETPTAAPSQSAPAPTASTGTELEGYYAQTLDWKDCKEGFECSTLSVPLDYANPSAKAISISVVRLKASGTSKGSLVVNPGGPGGSGIEYARAAKWIMSSTLLENFDIVGFDPRGVGASTPIDCLNDKQTDEYIAADGSPDDAAEIAASVAISKEFAAGCATNSPDLYGYVDTISAAKDIDILRAALGDEKLNWLGKSYGTFLGATYADLFPNLVGRMLLDGAIDPTLSNEELSKGQAIGFENALRRFVDDCPNHDDCPLDATGEAGVQEISDLLSYLDANPGKLDDGREFTQAMGVLGIVGSLYDKVYGWSELRPNLAAAFEHDYSALATSVDFYTSRNEDGTYGDNSNDAIAAVNCLDRPDRATDEQTIALAKEWKSEAPTFGEYLAWSNLGCTYWNIPATGFPRAIPALGSPTILVVGTVNDPATPYVWAQGLASQLSKGVLLTFDGDGHTAYFQGSACIDKEVDNYFLTGNATPGITCTDGP